MSIKVRYFASLKETLGRSFDDLDIQGVDSVRNAWCIANPSTPLPDNILAAVNMEYVTMEAPVSDGDVVAFFPPVTGG